MKSQDAPPTLGIRHIALNASDLGRLEKFYAEILGYRVEWRPDPDNVYLTNGRDSLALHKADRGPSGASPMDHFGILLSRPEDVDSWAAYLKDRGIVLKKEPRTHRDGARSFYVEDPEGNVIQFIHHPPLSGK